MKIAIIFGGASPEHSESVRAARTLYKTAIHGNLDNKYIFSYFYLSTENLWASSRNSRDIISGQSNKKVHTFKNDRMLSLKKVGAIYNTMMGSCGENGNIMGLANLLGIPMIGCDILASALSLDKHLSKIMVSSIEIPVVNFLYADSDDNVSDLITDINRWIKFPCFVKPTNLGTCAHVFRASDSDDFIKKWTHVIRENIHGRTYLIEKYIPNAEVRVFVYQDINGTLHTNDGYVTELKKDALIRGGVLFDELDNQLPTHIRKRICKYAKNIFRLLKMKDYARVDFFLDSTNGNIYFNEANTQPYISQLNIDLLKDDGLSYADFLEMMILRNIR